uniref:Uncharacterized protein n=1 Tax=Caenorhabditis japonica TaxID=281687 RepID=A0A8R1IYD4_CAEJA
MSVLREFSKDAMLQTFKANIKPLATCAGSTWHQLMPDMQRIKLERHYDSDLKSYCGLTKDSSRFAYGTSYGPKNRRKGNDYHIGSLNVRSISDQSKAKALDLPVVKSGCKLIALQETKRKECKWIMSSGAELISTRRETREGRLVFRIHKD